MFSVKIAEQALQKNSWKIGKTLKMKNFCGFAINTYQSTYGGKKRSIQRGHFSKTAFCATLRKNNS
jgi:hypothetical protein